MANKRNNSQEDLKTKLAQIAEEHNINPKQLQMILESEKYGAAAPSIDLSKHVKNEVVVFGALSDTMVNSTSMRPDIYRSLYAKFKEEGASYVFHCGNMTDGYMRYQGHDQDQITPDYETMLDLFFDPKKQVGYPAIGVNTYFIGGNNDKTFLKRPGEIVGYSENNKAIREKTDVCKDISEKRKDLVFAGWNGATIRIAPKTTVRLSHPLPTMGSRKAYAISYPVQRKVLAFGGGQKPDILLSGYFQKRFEFIARGIEVHMIPSCTGQTPNDLERDISAPALGGVIFKAHFNKDGSLEDLVSIDIPFYD